MRENVTDVCQFCLKAPLDMDDAAHPDLLWTIVNSQLENGEVALKTVCDSSKHYITLHFQTLHGELFVFCVGDCPFKSEPTSTSADACWEVTGCNAGHQEIGMCSTRGGS